MKLSKLFCVTFAFFLPSGCLVSCGNEPSVEITSISITNKANIATDMYIDDTQTLQFSFSATKGKEKYDLSLEEAINQNYVKFVSSDETKLSFESSGKVTALSVGQASASIVSSKNSEIKDFIDFTIYDHSIVIDSVTVTNEANFKPNLALNVTKTLELSIKAHTGRDDAVTLSGKEAFEQGLISLKSDNEAILTVDGQNVTAKGVGNTKLKILNKKNQTLKEMEILVVNREDGVLSLNLSEINPDGYKVRQGDSIEIPTASAYNEEGIDITNGITITSDKGETFANDGVFTSSIVGTHTLVYSITSASGSRVDDSIQVVVYQRVLTDHGSAKIVVSNEETNPVVTSSDMGVGIKSFYLPSGLSDKYYAEFKMSTLTNISENMIVALANFTSEELTPTESTPFTYFGFKFNKNNAFEFANSRVVTSWDVLWAPRMWSDANFLQGILSYNLFNSDTKLAVARDGNRVYYFINDVLAFTDINPAFFDVSSTPGILLLGNDKSAPEVSLKDFVILEGNEAMTKLKTLKPVSPFRYFTAYGDSLNNSANTFEENGTTFTDKIATENIGGFNSLMVTTNELYTTSDLYKWTVSFDMQVTKIGDNGTWGKMAFDLRTFHDKKSAVQFHIDYSSGAFGNVYLTNSEVGFQTLSLTSEFNADLNNPAPLTKCHFELSSYVSDFNEETLAINVSTVGENPLTWTKEVKIVYNNDVSYIVGCPKYLIWHAEKFSGIISNYSLNYESLY